MLKIYIFSFFYIYIHTYTHIHICIHIVYSQTPNIRDCHWYKICFHYAFMDKIETNFLTQEFKLLVCFRYIDDVFLIWTHGKEKLEEFLKDFNNYHPNIKLTHEFNKESIPFLDLRVSLCGGQLTIDLHITSTDKHQYLPYISLHPDHTKRSIVFSQA